MEKRMYQNPVVRGFYPDPSVLRVGEDYYLVNSSFQYFPAIPIHHSKDLVHWEIIGHAIVESEYLDLSDIADSHGIWAPDISYHNGKFYIFAPFRLNNAPENGTGRLRIQLVMTADRPEGPYSKPAVLEVDSIDPSHFVDDDGTHYMITAPGITVTKLNEDCTKVFSQPECVWRGTNRAPEGPHILKKDGWYYAILAEGGTGYGHRISVARAKNIYGPYEACPYNPVMMQTDPEGRIQKSGHGKLVQTQHGDWWAMYLCGRMNGGKFTTLGRETALDPVTWTEDGWFLINDGKGPSSLQEVPALPETVYPEEGGRDEFDAATLALDWCFVRNPKPGNWSLTERPGFLRLKGSLYDLWERRAYNTVVKRETEHTYTADTKLEYTPCRDGQEAGMVCYSGIYSYLKLCKCMDGGEVKMRVIKRRNGEQSLLGEIKLDDAASPILLKIEVQGQLRRFFYSLDGERWTLVAEEPDSSFLCSEEVKLGKHHTGTMVGLYAYNPAYTYTDADFDFFDLQSVRG